MDAPTRNTQRLQQPYERFQAWAAAHQLALHIYAVTRSWPASEKYGLTCQARRAAYSAVANICEGAGRSGPREFRRFLDISLASLSELAYILRLAADLEYLRAEERTETEILRDHAHRLTWGLRRAMNRGQKAAIAEG
jgi:four helix bundle protein